MWPPSNSANRLDIPSLASSRLSAYKFVVIKVVGTRGGVDGKGTFSGIFAPKAVAAHGYSRKLAVHTPIQSNARAAGKARRIKTLVVNRETFIRVCHHPENGFPHRFHRTVS